MDAGSVVVATITRARDTAEEHLILRAMRGLSRQGLRICASDGGSSAAFVEELRAIDGLTLAAAAQSGLVGQVKASVGAALAGPATHILYLESDKALFVEEASAAFISGASAAAPLIIASRSAASFATYPLSQRTAEGAFNAVAGEALGVEGDYLYGPFLMDRAAAAFVQLAGAAAGWGWRPFVFACAAAASLPVRLVPGDYPCPPDQRADTPAERVHRLKQLRENIDGLLQAQLLRDSGHVLSRPHQ